MREIDPKLQIAILRVLRDAAGAVGSSAVAEGIRLHGFQSSPRSIRLYLEEMERQGLVEPARRGRRGGRAITPRGLEEIQNALVAERVGFTAAKVDTLTWQMTFSPTSRRGKIVLNITLIDAGLLEEALDLMLPVFEAGLSMGDYLAIGFEGERLGEFDVPKGKAAIGTVCSVTINGALLSERIPSTSRFGGVLELNDFKPVRFTDVICYDGTSLDPLEIFIKGKLTSVRQAVETGRGRIGASFREIPSPALPEAMRTLNRLDRIGLGGVLLVGRPDQPLLDFPVPEGRTGLIVTGGLNPAAALEESGVATMNFALSSLFDFSRLVHFRQVKERLAKGDLGSRGAVATPDAEEGTDRFALPTSLLTEGGPDASHHSGSSGHRQPSFGRRGA
ncbi:MAG TPA: NrpR regulatory domain-containing protein [Sumerlaeia bacterium]|nr:NrpR regulatory domain-containing protein [Sumerlaeia bacterium]